MEAEQMDDAWETYSLQKNSPGCTGLFWRASPLQAGASAPFDNWPRDNALLKGIVHEVKGRKWLEVKALQQHGKKEYVAAPAGAWIPFEEQQYFLQASE